jgi:hypothetical protein
MSEDYTWNEAEPTRAHPVQVAALKEANARLAARVMELERENAELNQRCVHMERRLRSMLIDAIVDDGDPNTLTLDWGQLNDTQDDDTEAPLTLAAIDGEDGDL